MPVVCDVPLFVDFEKKYADQINQIVTLSGCPDIYQESQIRSPIRKFMRRVFLCPAAEEYHDAGPGGLVTHTLAVCQQALEQAKLNPDLNFKDRLALFVVTLVHDVVRAGHITVTDVSPNVVSGKKTTKPWEPTYEGMARWIEENGVTKVSMEFAANREIYGLSEACATVFILRLFNESYRLLIGQRREAAIISALTKKLPPPSIDLYSYFKSADRNLTVRERVGVSDKDVSQVWDSLQREVLAQRHWNEEPYYFLASETHVILPYTVNSPDPRVENFWRGIHGSAFPDNQADTFNNTTRRVVLDILKSYLVQCCHTGDVERDLLFLAERDGKRRMSVAVAWDSILGRHQKRPILETPPPSLRLFPSKDGNQLVITAADLGFVPDTQAMIEAMHISEIWRLLVLPPYSKDEKKIATIITDRGRIDPELKVTALTLIRRRVALQADKQT